MHSVHRTVFASFMTIGLALPALAVENTPEGIASKKQGNGWVFANGKGMTLYTFDRDEGVPGKSACNGDCAVTWPPHVAPADASKVGPWSTITREDGTKQWAYKGKPLYAYALDAFPGGAFGDGVNGAWRMAFEPIPTPGEASLGPSILGQVLTDAKGRTLYAFEKDVVGKAPACKDDCLRTWAPLGAPRLANAFGDWSVVVRDTGFRQWAYQGKPVYKYSGDVAPGEVAGNGIKGWSAVVLEPAPPLPPWATVQFSDAGDLIANEKGLTIYAHEFNPRNRRVLGRVAGCVGECIDGTDWVPFIAAAEAKPIGRWALVDLADGTKQWTYKGQKLYTNKLDTKPGDFKGIRFGGDRSWSAIMRSGQPMQGVTVGG
jgi:predicted lipoprotein with Yx(FWY)xxD motif